MREGRKVLTFSGPSSRRIPVDLAQGIKSSQSVSRNAARQRAAMAATAARSEGAWNESCISGARRSAAYAARVQLPPRCCDELFPAVPGCRCGRAAILRGKTVYSQSLSHTRARDPGRSFAQ